MPGLENMVIGKVGEPNNVGDPCAMEEVTHVNSAAKDGTQAKGADELRIVFGEDKS